MSKPAPKSRLMYRINLAPEHAPTTVVVVASGVDTLHLWTRAQLAAAQVERLLKARSLAESTGEPERIELGGVELAVAPWKLRKGSVLLESDFFALKIGPSASGTEATATIEVRALKLWSAGWRHAADQAVKVLAACCAEGQELDVQVGRCDVAIDFQGWRPTPADRVRFRSQSANRARYYAAALRPAWETRAVLLRELARIRLVLADVTQDASDDDLVAALERAHSIDRDLFSEFDQAGELTGYTFGRGGAVSARAYDKTRETRKTRKGHMRAVWRRNPDFREQQAVWRLEFQLMREGLRSLEITTPGGYLDLGAWEPLRSRVDAVWSYCTGKWLWHGTRTKDERKHFSRPWRQLHEQTIDQGYERADPAWRTSIERRVMDGALQPIHAGLAGYIVSSVAQQMEAAEGEVVDFHSGMKTAIELAIKDATRRGVDLPGRAQEKLLAIEDRRAHLREKKHPYQARHDLLLTREAGADG